MSNWCELRVGGVVFDDWQSEPCSPLMALFVETEKCQMLTPHEERRDLLIEDEVLEAEAPQTLEYVASATAIRERLEIIGFTIETAKRAFEIGRRQAIEEQWQRLAWARDWAKDGESGQKHLTAVEERVSVLETISPESWMHSLLEIRAKDLKRRDDRRADPELSAMVRYMLESPRWFGFPELVDPRHALRLVVEAFKDDSVVYDLTDLSLGEYLDSNDPIVDIAISWLPHEDRIALRVVVLTEGSTDKWVLQRSLRLLAPEIADFFSFMDFEGARIEGGAGPLASIVKSFVAAGIENRVIALFDNDTAGLAALRKLGALKFPENIVALHYPDIWLANDYPTIGPDGRA